MFSCTLQTSSTKIILLTSTRHPRTAGSLNTVNVGGSRASPLTQYDQSRHVILQSTCILQKKCSPVFLRVVNKRAKQLTLKGLITILLNRLNTVDLGPFRLLVPSFNNRIPAIKGGSRRLQWKRSSLILLLTSKRSVAFSAFCVFFSQHIITFVFNSYTGTRANVVK